ncbi:MAG TPA: homocysteine S-methyltransferase family protein [Candidatus Eisenbergiella merdipullorum]|uniref:Methionine synthase n=1 Tax=Candidatus Eisenbergiella merdipullorum TaxID=2838553 RepID=A0A9D2L006_9FIRM|nr:homocysteine S-methyltransferase family protein [Candidatus Eisenbergiella merdipullorum]
MTKQEFRDFIIKKGIVMLDGATGSNLMARGMPGGVCPEKWITEHPDVLTGLQREYVSAGTDILYAPTFTANRIKLAEYGLEKEIRGLTFALVQASKKAAGPDTLIAGDLTMTGEQLSPIGHMDLEELVDVYREQIGCLLEAGVDLLVVETMMSLQECRAAMIAAKETCPDLPVMVTMTFEQDGRSLYGTDAVTAAVVLESLGADAVGANCSTGPDAMAHIIRQMTEATRIPVIAKPNAGLPSLDSTGKTVYDMDAPSFAREMEAVYEAGAVILGGCCGTTPEHIRRLAAAVSGRKPADVPRRPEGIRYLTSERKTVSFGLSDPFLIIGERINPTGKKNLQAELREGRFDRTVQFAEEQEEAGASILDVNMGMSGVDEKELMLRAVEEVTQVTQLPLSLDSSHIDVLEAALRRYPGRALINSISLETEKFEKLIPMAKKYGAMFILLPLSDAGLPESLEEKKEIIDKIWKRAASLGLTREDIIVDGLVTTVGANPKAALETLETIRYCRQNGFATVVGLSNISFGLPERIQINSTFLTMAIQAGLTMAIANPSQQQLMAAAFVSDLLLDRRDAAERYIAFTGKTAEKKAAAPSAVPAEGASETVKKSDAESVPGSGRGAEIYESVLKGSRNGIAALTQKALDEGMEAGTILNDFLMPAINRVGELFDSGKYFLPQLISGAETMKLSISVLEPHLLQEKEREALPVVILATVKGDIHDIGKNLVALMMKNYGFQVLDLGKDVPAEDIIRSAQENHAALIGLSALMTTTMQEMKHVIALAKETGLTAKIIIGGAVITQDYADEIHADGYAKDAADAVRVAKRLLGL